MENLCFFIVGLNHSLILPVHLCLRFAGAAFVGAGALVCVLMLFFIELLLGVLCICRQCITTTTTCIIIGPFPLYRNEGKVLHSRHSKHKKLKREKSMGHVVCTYIAYSAWFWVWLVSWGNECMTVLISWLLFII